MDDPSYDVGDEETINALERKQSAVTSGYIIFIHSFLFSYLTKEEKKITLQVYQKVSHAAMKHLHFCHKHV